MSGQQLRRRAKQACETAPESLSVGVGRCANRCTGLAAGMIVLSASLSLQPVACAHSDPPDHAKATAQASSVIDPALPVAADSGANDATIRFLEQRIANDPADFVSANRLGALYLQRPGRHADHADLERARAIVTASLDIIPADMNPAAVLALAQVEFASHNFVAAQRHARRAMVLSTDTRAARTILGDALREAGDYAGAARVYRQLENADDAQPAAVVSLQTRRAQLAWLTGDTDTAAARMRRALAAARALPPGHEHQLAWCLWQAGTMAFARGDPDAARQAQIDALRASPGYLRAIAEHEYAALAVTVLLRVATCTSTDR